MKNRLLTGLGKYLVPVPSFLWKPKIVQKAKKAAALMGFMTPDHHRVRNFVVKTLAESGRGGGLGLSGNRGKNTPQGLFFNRRESLCGLSHRRILKKCCFLLVRRTCEKPSEK